MMNYRPANKSRVSFRTLFFTLFILIAVVAINSAQSKALPGFIYAIVSPVWRAESSLGQVAYGFISYFQSKNSLAAENQKLKGEILLLQNELAGKQDLEQENNSLKELMGRDNSTKAVLAAVLSAPPFSPYDSLIIDIGANSGVGQGDVVIGPGNVALGAVAEVYQSFAKVELFSTPGKETQVLIGKNKVQALAKGVGGGAFEVILPKDMKVEQGDAVIMPGLEAPIYGVVSSVVTRDVDFLQLVTFKSPENIFETRFVGVILNSNHETGAAQ